jgi:5-methylthioadenosine/S-adenosylhomocysteine deaminase
MTEVDIIVKADHVLKMDADLTVIQRGAIAVKDGRIASVGPESEVSAQYSSSKILGGRGFIAFPGLVNTHTHAAMVYFRGLKDDLPLKKWLEEHIWPAEERWLSYEFVENAVELACLEMLKAGITAYNDMYFYGDAVARSTRRLGMRAVVGAGIVDFPSKTAKTSEEYFSNAEKLISDWKGDDLIIPAIAPHSTYACSTVNILRAKKIADRYGVPLHTHLSETAWEVSEMKKMCGKTSIELLDSIGVLDERVIAAHCVWATDKEIEILAAKRVGVAHCIESNLKLASGIAPVIKMLEAGIKVTFGTDGAASNNDLDILSEMSTAAKVHKAVSEDPTALNAGRAMLMATRWGAEALGLGDVTGSIEEGKAADIVVANIKKPHLIPLYDIFSHIVYSMDSSDIDTVIVNGKVLINSGTLVSGDESKILNKAVEWGQKIKDGGR